MIKVTNSQGILDAHYRKAARRHPRFCGGLRLCLCRAPCRCSRQMARPIPKGQRAQRKDCSGTRRGAARTRGSPGGARTRVAPLGELLEQRGWAIHSPQRHAEPQRGCPERYRVENDVVRLPARKAERAKICRCFQRVPAAAEPDRAQTGVPRSPGRLCRTGPPGIGDCDR